MYKVVLCAFFAVAAAKPDLLITAPGYTTYVAPATTTITKQASSVIHPSPLTYNAPLIYSHLIKKRSPQLTYIASPGYYASSPLATTYTTPYLHADTILPAGTLPIPTAHLIKKRSALLTPTFVAPTTYSAYSTSLIPTAPLLSSATYIDQPYGLATHFIKKRSAPVLSTYVAPSSYSHQSRIDLQSTPWISSYAAPWAYSAPVSTFSHVY